MKQASYIGPISQLICMDELPLKGALSDELLNPKSQYGILIQDGFIVKIAPFDQIKTLAIEMDAKQIVIPKDSVVIPGMIDAHTHICWAGSRERDYALRNAGVSYLEIAAQGGGIWDTVTQTRVASLQTLVELTRQRANQLLQQGITTIEVKSGYGLSVEEELKILRAIDSANTQTQADLIATCLAAHIFPKDYDGSPSDYLDEIAQKLLPVLKEEDLCHRVDAFLEQEAFNASTLKPYIEKAKELGFDSCIHADQFSVGGSSFAVEMESLSADHLEASGDLEIDLLAKSDTVAVALPGASIGLGVQFTPARKLLDAGACLAIATDWNPGSAPMGHLLTQASILGSYEKLSNAELLAGITFRAAFALNLKDRGILRAGLKADMIVFPTDDYRRIFYTQGRLNPSQIIKSGTLIP
jgi:imidazolonepropionase